MLKQLIIKMFLILKTATFEETKLCKLIKYQNGTEKHLAPKMSCNAIIFSFIIVFIWKGTNK